MIDNDILDGDQDQEDHRSDDVIPADHETAEGADHLPAADVPVLPFSRIRRDDEMFSDRRKSVNSSSVVGNEVNSTGRTSRARPSGP